MRLHRDETGKLPAFAWPGGYPMYYFDKHGDVLCPRCANREIDDSAAIVNGGVYWEGPIIQCDDCGEDIESAYGDPEESE